MAHQKLFNTLQRICNFSALETEMAEIIDACKEENDAVEEIRQERDAEWLAEIEAMNSGIFAYDIKSQRALNELAERIKIKGIEHV